MWSIGEGQDYVHLQLAEGCTGNGKHAENFAQVTLGPAQAAAEVSTVAHWRFQDVDGYYTGSVDDDNLTFVDLTAAYVAARSAEWTNIMSNLGFYWQDNSNAPAEPDWDNLDWATLTQKKG